MKQVKRLLYLLFSLFLFLGIFTTIIVKAHSGDVLSAWAEVIPTIDGILSPGEWDDADSVSFLLTYPEETHPVTLWVKNDDQFLYLAVEVLDDDQHPEDGVFFHFDNDNDGSLEQGDDWLIVVSGTEGEGHAIDGFVSGTNGRRADYDTSYDGTNDILGASSHTNVGGIGDYSFELRHPLDTTDDAHDFSLSLNDVVGVQLECDDAFPGGSAPRYWPSSVSFADILIASNPEPERASVSGYILYNDEPVTQYTDVMPEFFVRDEDTGMSVHPLSFTYNTVDGYYEIFDLPPGRYGVEVFIDAAKPYNTEHGFPNDYEGWKSPIIIEEDITVTQDLAISKVIHLTSPVDNIEEIGYGDEKDTYDGSPLFTWDPITEASQYYFVIMIYSEEPFGYLGEAYSTTTSLTSLQPELPLNGENEFYECDINAYNEAWTRVGILMVHFDSGHGWDYQFKIGMRARAPEAVLYYSPSDPKEGDPVTFDASDSYDPDGGSISCAWLFGDGDSGEGRNVVHVYDDAGIYTVTLTVTDNDGLTDTDTTSIMVKPPTYTFNIYSSPPGVSFTLDGVDHVTPFPTSLEEGTYSIVMPSTITIEGKTYDFDEWENGYIHPSRVIDLKTYTTIRAQYEEIPPETGTLSIDTTPVKGTVLVNGISWGTTPASHEVEVGTYTVSYGDIAGYFTPDTVETIVEYGKTTNTMGIYTEITEKQPPVSDAGDPYTVQVDVSLTFDGTNSYDPGGTIVSYAWNFGDGEVGTGATASHTYDAVGTYTVTLTVTDNGGLTDSDTTTATVSTPPSPDTSWITPPVVIALITVFGTIITALITAYFARTRTKEKKA